MAASKKALIEKQKQALASIVGSKGAAAGFEEADSSSYAIPFLRILQKLSPEVDKDEAAYIKGAKPGMILHTIRKEVYDEVEVIPVFYRKVYIEWVLRENGGGFRGEYGLDMGEEMRKECAQNDKGQLILPNGNQLSETANHYVLFHLPKGDLWEPVLISMSSSQLTFSRQWMSLMRGATITVDGTVYHGLNMEAYRWCLSTTKRSNDKGTWFGWKAEQGNNTMDLPFIPDQAANARDIVTSGRVSYDRDQQAGGAAEAENAL